MKADDIRDPQQIFHGHRCDILGLPRDPVIGDDPAAEGLQETGDIPSDLSGSDKADRLSGKLGAQEAAPRPSAPGRRIESRDLPQKIDHHRNGQFSDRRGRVTGRVRDDDPALPAGGRVDVIVSGEGGRDHPQIRARFDEFTAERDVGEDDRVGAGSPFDEREFVFHAIEKRNEEMSGVREPASQFSEVFPVKADGFQSCYFHDGDSIK